MKSVGSSDPMWDRLFGSRLPSFYKNDLKWQLIAPLGDPEADNGDGTPE